MNSFSFIKSLWSPFKPFKLRFYIGKVAIGTPYFFPRKWVKGTPELAHKATLEYIESEKKYNELNPNYTRKIKPYEEIYEEKLKYSYPIRKKIGFDFVRLGWKTKWKPDDYRFEWAPLLSFVFFKWQIVIFVDAPYQDHYWESWLYYELNTDKKKSKRERIKQCKEEFKLDFTYYHPGATNPPEKINYYNLILRKKYIS